jgi:hypothetical protein
MIRLQKLRKPLVAGGMRRRTPISEALRQKPHNTWFLLLRHVRCL